MAERAAVWEFSGLGSVFGAGSEAIPSIDGMRQWIGNSLVESNEAKGCFGWSGNCVWFTKFTENIQRESGGSKKEALMTK